MEELLSSFGVWLVLDELHFMGFFSFSTPHSRRSVSILALVLSPNPEHLTDIVLMYLLFTSLLTLPALHSGISISCFV